MCQLSNTLNYFKSRLVRLSSFNVWLMFGTVSRHARWIIVDGDRRVRAWAAQPGGVGATMPPPHFWEQRDTGGRQGGGGSIKMILVSTADSL